GRAGVPVPPHPRRGGADDRAGRGAAGRAGGADRGHRRPVRPAGTALHPGAQAAAGGPGGAGAGGRLPAGEGRACPPLRVPRRHGAAEAAAGCPAGAGVPGRAGASGRHVLRGLRRGWPGAGAVSATVLRHTLRQVRRPLGVLTLAVGAFFYLVLFASTSFTSQAPNIPFLQSPPPAVTAVLGVAADVFPAARGVAPG